MLTTSLTPPTIFQLTRRSDRYRVATVHVYSLFRARPKMAATLNRLIGLGAGLAITGAVVNSTLYNGKYMPRSANL